MINKEILIGSTYFFKDYPDFNSHDKDILIFTDYNHDFTYYKEIYLNGTDIIYFVLKDKQTMITEALEFNLSIQFGKFLINDVINILDLTIEDLQLLQPLVDGLDDKHKYQKIIYNSYIENNGFYLTEEQRLQAYSSYKETRKDV